MTDSGAVELTFDRPTTVTVGARSLHTRPEGDDHRPGRPDSARRGGVRTRIVDQGVHPERSWPTLRGTPRSASVTNSTSRVRSSLPTPASRWSCDPRMPTCSGSPRSRTTSAPVLSSGMRRRSDSTPATSSPCRPKVARSKSASRSYSDVVLPRHAGADGGVRQIRPIRVRTGGSEAPVLPAETGRSVDERAADGVLRG